MRDPFAFAAKSILTALGQDAFLRNAPCGKVNVEFGVDTYTDQGATVKHDVATIENQYHPKRGDRLDMTDGSGNIVRSYRIDMLLHDNGYTKRHIVLPWA